MFLTGAAFRDPVEAPPEFAALGPRGDGRLRGHGRAREGHGQPASTGRDAQPARAATCGAIARNARDRWLTAFFSSGVSSAALRVSPSGRNTGS
jgi:hypothetical protein